MKAETSHRDTLSQALAEWEIYAFSDCEWCAGRSARNYARPGLVHLGVGEGATGAHLDFVVAHSPHRFTT
jgi:hypothetical protein